MACALGSTEFNELKVIAYPSFGDLLGVDR